MMKKRIEKNSEDEKKVTRFAKLSKKGRLLFAVYAVLVLIATVFVGTCLAADDPLTVVNNLSDFIFSLIRAIGLILLGLVALGLTVSIRRKRR